MRNSFIVEDRLISDSILLPFYELLMFKVAPSIVYNQKFNNKVLVIINKL